MRSTRLLWDGGLSLPTVRTKSQNEICSEHILVFRTYLTYYPAKQGCTSTFTAFMFVYLEVYILP